MAELAGRLEAVTRAAGLRTICVAGERAGEVGDRKGAYLLALHLPRAVDLKAIKCVPRAVDPGCYVYAGSARGPGGLEARLSRHLRSAKAVHWHIDRLTTQADGMLAFAVPDARECHLVGLLLGTRRFRTAVAGFGSSDCRNCEGHLLVGSG